MKDTKTVLPTINGSGENKNGFHPAHKHPETKTHDEHERSRPTTATVFKNGSDNEELVGGCCVCSDDQGFANNALVYCDGKECTVACHTACYGIVSIPDGDWYCGRCEAGDLRAPCRLCPIVEGAMKRTSDGGWAHVVCALYIPEVSFGDDATMQPIVLSKIPSTRFGQECSICIQNGRSQSVVTSGACCACTVKNCSQVFHVTCAQANGLLCEDVRKNNCQYPIYCEQHRPKLSKFIRQIPAFPYSPNALASAEQLKKQHLLAKEKDNPSQLSDFIATVSSDAPVDETDPTLSSSTLDETHNQSTTSDEQQTPVPRAFHSVDVLPRKSSSNTTNSSLSSSSTSVSPVVQHKSHSRSSSTSSSSNSSLQKKAKLHEDANRSLTDLSQFVQLNKEERSFLPPAPPPPPSSSAGAAPTGSQTHDREGPSAATHSDTSAMETRDNALRVGNPDSQGTMSSVEEKSLASRFPGSSSSTDGSTKSSIKQRRSTDTSVAHAKTPSYKKPFAVTLKDDTNDEDFQIPKKRKLSIKLSKDDQPRKQRQHSSEGGSSRPVGRPSSKKPSLAQPFTNGLKRPVPKPSNSNNMKQQKFNDTVITMQQNSAEFDHDNEAKLKSRSTHYYPCDHFGNQINSDVLKQHARADEQSPSMSATDATEQTSRSRVPSSSATTPRIDFYPRRPLQDALTSSASSEPSQQRTFPPQTLEEFLEQEWELSSDFLLQQTMPHDVSSLLSCLYQFKSENAALHKKFDELKHRRDSLRVTNANLRRRLSEILPINETIPTGSATQLSSPPGPVSTATTAVLATPIPAAPAPSVVLSVIPPSPRKEQQQLKQQKLLAELELQQHLQQQKAVSPTRRRLSTNAPNQFTESPQPVIKKSKSPRQSSSSLHQSILENQLRQSASSMSIKKSTTPTSAKKSNSAASDMELISHHSSLSANPVTLPSAGSSSSPYEQIDVAATAAAAYALSKNGRTAPNPSLSLELLTQILAASGNAISPQLFAPTWNISNFGYANFPGANPMSVSDESILRSYAPSTHAPLEQQQQQQQQQPSTKQQP